VQNRAQFYQFLIESRSGSRATLGISRNGEPQSIPVELGVRRAAFLDERQRLFGDADAMLERAEELRREAEELRKNGDEEGALDLLEEEKELRRQSEETRASIEDSIRSGKISRSPAGWYPNFNINPNRYYLGIIAVPLTEQLANYFKVARGVLVSEVRAGGAAERAGVRAGDCIIAVNNESVTSTSDLNRSIDRLDEGRAAGEKTGIEFYLNIVRDRNEQQIKIKIEQR
jgi:PDZ domain